MARFRTLRIEVLLTLAVVALPTTAFGAVQLA